MTEISVQATMEWVETWMSQRPYKAGADDILDHLRRLAALEAENALYLADNEHWRRQCTAAMEDNARMRAAVRGATSVCLAAANNRTIIREDREIYSLLADGLRAALGEPKP